jgi:signal transduction histidine kinase
MTAGQQVSAPGILLSVRDVTLLEALEDLITSYKLRVSVTTNPYKLPELCRATPFDVTVLDMDFPECQSGRIASLLQDSSAANPRMRVVLLCTFPPSPDLIADLPMVSAYLLKPFDPAWLLRSIREAMRIAEAERESEALRAREAAHADALRALEAKINVLQTRSQSVELAASMTHELKNLLSIIKVSAHYLIKKAAETKADPKQCKHLDIINQQVDRIQEQIIRYSSFVRGEELRVQPCNVNEAVRAVLSLVEFSLGNHAITVRAELQEGLPLVELQDNALRHILLNLVLNARDAMPQGGRLAVGTLLREAEGNGAAGVIELHVADTGQGIPPGMEEKVFEPFFTTKKGSSASGLGLSISRQLSATFGGALLLAPESTSGAHFVLTIPVGRETPRKRDATRDFRKDNVSAPVEERDSRAVPADNPAEVKKP